MCSIVKNFYDFINEDLNYNISELGDIEFENRWFYYEPEDEIIYGSDVEPVNVENLFYFNPKTCVIHIDDKEYEYDINNPCLIITCSNDNEVKMYKEDKVFEYLEEELGCDLNFDVQSQEGKKKIQKLFDNLDDEMRILFLYGTKVISTTFDIIEEN